MSRKTAPQTHAMENETARRRPAEPAEGDDAVARAARDAAIEDANGRHQLGLQKTREVRARDVKKDVEEDTFSEEAIGGLEADDAKDESNRQDAETEELEEIEPDIDPFKSPR